MKRYLLLLLFIARPASRASAQDVVGKGHGGSITVDTKEGEYTIFTINLPLM